MVAQMDLWSEVAEPFLAPVEIAPNIVVELRPYQHEAIEAIDTAVAGGDNRDLLHLATGLGKTVIFCEYARRRNGRTLILAHRDELVKQAVGKLKAIWPGVDVGIVKGNRNEVGAQITVASVQTLYRDNRFNRAFPDLDKWPLSTLITDEAHHSYAQSYKDIYARFGLMAKGGNGAVHLGVTATPRRGDKQPLKEVFDCIPYSMGMGEGILKGYLADLIGYTVVFANPDMENIRSIGGDFEQEALGKAVRKVARCESIVEAWKQQARRDDGDYRPTIAFCVDVEHSEMLAETFVRYGIKADVVHGEQSADQRERVINQYKDGQIDVLVNCMVLTEGFDAPATACVIIARPTKNASLYIQMAGRGTRLSSETGKTDCLIINVTDTVNGLSVDAVVTLEGALGLKKSLTNAFLDGLGDSIAKQLKMKMEGVGGGLLAQLEQPDVISGQIFDPFATGKGTSFNWTKNKLGQLVLPLGKGPKTGNDGYVVVARREDGLYDYALVQREGRATVSQHFVNRVALPDQPWAAREAERYALRLVPGISRLKSKDAQWRDRPASEFQIETLRKMRMESSIKPNLTKGQASDLLDKAFARSVTLTISRRETELENI